MRVDPRARLGFTLVELMMSVLVSAIVITAIYAFFIVQTRTYETQQLLAEMDGSVRFSHDIISQWAGNAGALANDQRRYGGIGDEVNVGGTGFVPDTPIPSIESWSNDTTAIRIVAPDPDTTMQLVVTGDTKVDCLNQGAVETLEMHVNEEAGGHNPMETLGEISTSYVGVAPYFLICHDYARPQGQRAFIWRINDVDAFVSPPSVFVWGHAIGAHTDYDAECDGEPLPQIMECAGAQLTTLTVNGFSLLGDPVLYASLGDDFPNGGDPFMDSNKDVPLVVGVRTMKSEAYDNAEEIKGTNWTVNPIAGGIVDDARMFKVTLVAESSRGAPTGREMLVPTHGGLLTPTNQDHILRSQIFVIPTSNVHK